MAVCIRQVRATSALVTRSPRSLLPIWTGDILKSVAKRQTSAGKGQRSPAEPSKTRRRAAARPEPLEYPTCARHAKPRKDVRLRHYFLCDSCTSLWTGDAFAGTVSLYDGEVVPGLCMLCNQPKSSVRLRTWFLCDICHRVAGSIGRNHVAERAIMEFWESTIAPRFPFLTLTQNDASSLRPRREVDAVTGEGPLDFLVTDSRSKKVVFGIENKTGRGSIRDMSEFQLDKSDCDSIIHHMRSMAIPAYVIHAQVLEVWQPPTMGFRAVGLWWTDAYLMTEHFRRMKDRADEKRPAAYFSRRAFAPIETLAASLFELDELALVKRFSTEGVPPMYRLPE